MAIVLNAVLCRGAATKDAFVLTSDVNKTHSAHRDPSVSPSSDNRSVDARLSGGTNHLANADESGRVLVSRLIHPFRQKSPCSGRRRVRTWFVYVLHTQIFL